MKNLDLFYEMPKVDIIEIAIETGFATSGSLEDIDEENIPIGW